MELPPLPNLDDDSGLPPLPDLPPLFISDNDIRKKSPEEIEKMIKEGADPNIGAPLVIAIDKYGDNTISSTTKKRFKNIIDLLLKVPNLNIDQQTSSGTTPLMASVTNNLPGLFMFFLKTNPDLRKVDYMQRNVLLHVLENDRTDILTPLLEYLYQPHRHRLLDLMLDSKDIEGNGVLSYCVSTYSGPRYARDMVKTLNIILPLYVDFCIKEIKDFEEVMIELDLLPKDIVGQISNLFPYHYRYSFDKAIRDAQLSKEFMKDTIRELSEEKNSDEEKENNNVMLSIIQLLREKKRELDEMLAGKYKNILKMIGKKIQGKDKKKKPSPKNKKKSLSKPKKKVKKSVKKSKRTSNRKSKKRSLRRK